MKIFFITLIITLINTCVLRKPAHCKANNVVKRRFVEAFKDKAPDESQTSIRSSNDEIIDTNLEPENKIFRTNSSHEHSLDKNLENKLLYNHGDIDKSPNMPTDDRLLKIYKISNKNERKEFINTYKRFLLGDIQGFYELLKLYLKKNISEKQQIHYILRIENINETYKNLVLNEQYSLKASLIFQNYNDKIINLLKIMISKVWIDKQPLYYVFNIISYKKIIKETELLPLLEELNTIDEDTREFYFNYEILKCMKHSYLFPVFMILGGIGSEPHYSELTFNIHLIRMLTENFRNNKKAEKLSFFLIYLAFKQSLKKRSLNIFSIKELKTVCFNKQKNEHKINFFYLAWELEKNNRQLLKEVLSEQNHLSEIHCSNNNHLKLLTLIYLYQHLVFLKFKNGNDFKIDRKYINLFDNFFTEKNNCFACGFEEFIRILREEQVQNKN